jgi:hypothetical protein
LSFFGSGVRALFLHYFSPEFSISGVLISLFSGSTFTSIGFGSTGSLGASAPTSTSVVSAGVAASASFS